MASALAVLACVVQACLVTTDVDYNRPNTPAMVTKLDPKDFTAVVSDCKESQSGMRFRVGVFDPDVEDKLQARVLVNGKTVDGDRVTGTQAQRDTFSSCVPYTALNVACSHVEIYVTNEFVEIQPGEHPTDTVDPHDVGSVEWWLLGPVDNFAEIGVGDCQMEGKAQP